jgi:Family of unknown function (DUF6328)
MIAPVAVHRFTFRPRVKDEVVSLTNTLAIAGLAVLSLAMTGAVLLICDWVAGPIADALCSGRAALVFVAAWLALPWWLGVRASGAQAQTGRRPDV